MSQGQAQEFEKIVSPGAPCDCTHPMKEDVKKKILSPPCSDDTRSDQQHAFAAFVHAKDFSMFAFCSP